LAPRELAPSLQSLPPILHMKDQNPISGYSKGARGLSVQSRVSGIFTAATVSPSSCRRQQSSRYTIRAGRNLPDKEFRSSSPHVAMRLGPYLHLARARGWRVASEDSWMRLLRTQAFPADCPHRTHCHRVEDLHGSAGFNGVPSIWPASNREIALALGRPGRTSPGSYLRTVRHCYSRPGEVGGSVISAELFASPRRPDYPITTRASRVWRLVSEDSRMLRGSLRPCSGDSRRRSCPIESGGLLRPDLDPSTPRTAAPRAA